MRKRGCERIRQAAVLWQKNEWMGVAANNFLAHSSVLQKNQWCMFSHPAAAAFLRSYSVSVPAPHTSLRTVLQHGRFIKHPQQSHLLFFCQFGVVYSDLPHQRAYLLFQRRTFKLLRIFKLLLGLLDCRTIRCSLIRSIRRLDFS